MLNWYSFRPGNFRSSIPSVLLMNDWNSEELSKWCKNLRHVEWVTEKRRAYLELKLLLTREMIPEQIQEWNYLKWKSTWIWDSKCPKSRISHGWTLWSADNRIIVTSELEIHLSSNLFQSLLPWILTCPIEYNTIHSRDNNYQIHENCWTTYDIPQYRRGKSQFILWIVYMIEIETNVDLMDDFTG